MHFSNSLRGLGFCRQIELKYRDSSFRSLQCIVEFNSWQQRHWRARSHVRRRRCVSSLSSPRGAGASYRHVVLMLHSLHINRPWVGLHLHQAESYFLSRLLKGSCHRPQSSLMLYSCSFTQPPISLTWVHQRDSPSGDGTRAHGAKMHQYRTMKDG